MPTTHKVFTWIGGDDWQYHIRLTNDEGDPYDIDSLTEVKWLMHNGDGEIFEHKHMMRTVDSADGRIVVWISADETTCFPGGNYTDYVRINCGGIIKTIMMGPIYVTEDPWRAPVTSENLCRPAAERRIRPIQQSSAEVVIALSRQERIVRRALPDTPAEIVPLRAG